MPFVDAKKVACGPHQDEEPQQGPEDAFGHVCFDFAERTCARWTTALASRIARASSPVRLRAELATSLHMRWSRGEFAREVCRLASRDVQGIGHLCCGVLFE